MEWPAIAQSLIGSAVGSSPAAALSFYWAKMAWKARETAESDHAQELLAKDKLIAEKDALIRMLQEQRIEDLRQILALQKPAPSNVKPPGSRQPF